MSEKKHKLQNYVYRVLARRLILATLLLSAVLAAFVYISQRNQIGDLVVETALNRINILRIMTIEALQEPGTEPEAAFQNALHSLQSANLQQEHGQFVYARFFTPQGQQFAERSLHQTTGIQQQINQHLGTWKSYPNLLPSHRAIRIENRPYIHLVAPIMGQSDDIIAYGEAFFAVSDAALKAQRSALFRTIGWILLIVLITVAILYPVIIRLTRHLVDYSEDLMQSHLETVQILGSAIAKRDSDTSAHNFRVTIMAVRVAEALGMDPVTIKRLIIGAFLHDVGKIGIRDEILLKPGSLDEGEFEVMKTHVDHGVDIIARTEWLRDELPEHVDVGVELLAKSSWLTSANKVVANHHEKFDGSGYPQGLAAEAIPLEARIFSVVDVFDALTCRRPYKKPFSFEKSMAILEEGRGSHFDPVVLDTFNPLAEELYKQIAGREDNNLQIELETATKQFFYAGLETLEY